MEETSELLSNNTYYIDPYDLFEVMYEAHMECSNQFRKFGTGLVENG